MVILHKIIIASLSIYQKDKAENYYLVNFPPKPDPHENERILYGGGDHLCNVMNLPTIGVLIQVFTIGLSDAFQKKIRQKLSPVGFELTTSRSLVPCSTTVLTSHDFVHYFAHFRHLQQISP